MSSPVIRAVILPLALCAAPLAAQSVPRTTLGQPEARLADPFDHVSAVRELRDGRVIVADHFAKTVTLADLRTGATTAIGREGQGPGEYAFPIGLVALPGDTTLLVDPGQRRFMVIGPDAKPAGLLSFPHNMGGLVQARGADREGRIYLQGSGLSGDPNGPLTLPDSAPVIRWNRAHDRMETVGQVKLPSVQQATSNSGGARAVVMRREPFAPQDDWAVGADGRVGVLRAANYHAEWWTPAGQRVSGPAVVYEKVPVTSADKERYRKAAAANQRGGFRIQIGGSGGGRAGPPPPVLDEPTWPPVKPPFREATLLVAPDGVLWAERYGADGAARVYDLFDAQGRLVRQVELPKASRLVGFGPASLYVATTTEDDLEALSRYRLP